VVVRKVSLFSFIHQSYLDRVLDFVTEYVEALDQALHELDSQAGLSRLQKKWLGFCLLAIVVTNSVCWAQMERASFGRYRAAALSWMFRKSQILWEKLLFASVKALVAKYHLKSGALVVDDTDKRRSKSITTTGFSDSHEGGGIVKQGRKKQEGRNGGQRREAISRDL
jgi:hypothetical protein